MVEQNRIVKALSGFYYVQTPDGVVECRARGRFRKEGVTPLVGDLVEITVEANGKGTVDAILPRRNSFLRPAVANIDLLVVLASCAIPETEPFLIDRIFAIAGRRSVPVLLCINKNDLRSGEELRRIYEHAGFDVLCTSAETGEGIAELRERIKGKLTAFTGNSGVGKSSVLNAMEPELRLAVGEVSEKLGRGRHTTRHIELYRFPDARCGYARLFLLRHRRDGADPKGRIAGHVPGFRAVPRQMPVPGLLPPEGARLRRARGAGKGASGKEPL